MVVSYAIKGSVVNDDLGSIRTFLGVCFPACIHLLLWRFAVRRRWFDALAVAVAMISVFLIKSRTAIVTTPISLVLMAVLLGRHYKPKANLGLLFCIALVAAVVSCVGFTIVSGAHLDVLDRFNAYNFNLDIRDVGFEDVDAERRIVNYAAERMFADHRLVGAGYMTTPAFVGDLYGRQIAAHGWLGTLLGELGIIGATLFSFAILRFFSGLRRAIRNAQTLKEVTFLQASAVTLLSLLIAGLFQQVHQLPMFFTILAWGYASSPFGTGSLSRVKIRS
jgi:O-antigen ligase